MLLSARTLCVCKALVLISITEGWEVLSLVAHLNDVCLFLQLPNSVFLYSSGFQWWLPALCINCSVLSLELIFLRDNLYDFIVSRLCDKLLTFDSSA